MSRYSTSTPQPESETTVIGGGISGLVVASSLAQRGYRVTLLESSDRVGGLIQSHCDSGYQIESGANMILNYRPEVRRFLQQHQLYQQRQSRQQGATRNRYLVHNGGLHPLPTSPWRVLTSPLWSRSGKLRILAEPFIPKGGHAHESVSEFIQRRLGTEALERGIEPFVSGILASDPDTANAMSTLPRLTTLEQRYGSITAGVLSRLLRRRRGIVRSEGFSFQGGMAQLTTSLAQTAGLTLRTAHRVEQLITPAQSGNGRWRLEVTAPAQEKQLECDHIVIATEAPGASTLIAPFDTETAAALAQIEYAPLAVVHTGINVNDIPHPLDGSGFLVPRSEGRTINGNLWMSQLFGGRAPQGVHLMSSYVGGARNPHLLQYSNEELIGRTADDIGHYLNRGRRQAEPVWGEIIRHNRALPLYQHQHPALLSQLKQIEGHHPSLHLVGNYRDGISIRDRIVAGIRCADTITSQSSLEPEWELQPR